MPTPDPPSPSDRLIALEEKLTFLEHHVGQLDEVIRGLHVTVDALRDEVKVQREAMKARQWEEEGEESDE